jgi:hypothetical protein
MIVVNAQQNGASWKLSDTCQGPLTLDSISNEYDVTGTLHRVRAT